MNKKLMTGVVLCSMGVGLAQGAIRFHASGSWDMLEGVGQTEGWQSAVAPGTLDTVRANWGGDDGNIVTLNYAAGTVKNFELGVGESGEFNIQNGGVLTTLEASRIGNNGATALRQGTLSIDAGGTVDVGQWLGIGYGTYGYTDVSGVLNVTDHLWMGSQGTGLSVGYLTVENGGVVSVGGQLGMGTINASTPSGGTAFITVNSGGLLNLHHWSGTGSIQDGSVITINDGGSVVVGGNRVAQSDAYAALGKLTSDLGTVEAVYTEVGDFTTLTAVIPEPATLGLIAAFGGVMLFVRRRFKR
jgi:hypothetical protein